MKKRRKDKRIIISILIALCFLSGCGFRESLADRLKEAVSQEHSEESSQLAEELIKHKMQVEDTQIVSKEDSSSQDETETAHETKVSGEKKEEMEEATEQESALFANRFYYSYLSDSMKVVYEEIYNSILTGKEVEVSTLSKENMDIAFQCVLNDFPEIFYVSGYHYTEHTRATEIVKLVFKADYTMSKEEIQTAQTAIDAYVQKCFAGMQPGMSQYEQVKYVHDYIINNTEYHLDAPNNQNICSVFVEGRSVCQGYAEATQYLLQKRGFVIAVVNGYVDNGNRHAWNILMVDGNYYYLDTTWGDVDYQSAEGYDTGISKEVMPINYDYFLITTSQLKVSHQINPIISMPECVATENNYYRKEGLYFESVDEEKLEQVFQHAKEVGETAVTIKCSDASVYEAMRTYLLTEQGIFRYTENKEKVTYYDSSQMGTLCFWLE